MLFRSLAGANPLLADYLGTTDQVNPLLNVTSATATGGAAGGFTNLVLTRLLDTEFRVNWTASITCVILTAFLANLAGWLASFRILGQKPLEVLREE